MSNGEMVLVSGLPKQFEGIFPEHLSALSEGRGIALRHK